MAVTRRKPTGKPPWPHILLAGSHKAGKSIEVALASAIPFIGQTFWITFGERSGDEYGQVPGSRFEIVECDDRHDLKAAVRDLVRESRVEPDRPNLIAFDGGTALWELLHAEAQDKADGRAARKAKGNSFDPTRDYDVTTDLWNEARDHWYEVINPLLGSQDLVIITTRLDEVTIMENGQPTKAKEWKPAAHKRIAGDVDAVVHFRGEWPDQKRLLVGARSFELSKTPGLDPRRAKDYGIAALLKEMNINPETVESAAGPQTPRPEGRMPSDWEGLLAGYVEAGEVQKIKDLWGVANRAGDEDAKATIGEAGKEVAARKSAGIQSAAQARTAKDRRPAASAEPPVAVDEVPQGQEPTDDEAATAMEAAVKAAGPLTEKGPEVPHPPADATPEEAVEWARTFAWGQDAERARREARRRIGDAREAGDVGKLDAAIRQATSQGWADILRDAQGAKRMATAR